jgi:hypothetical protein
MNKFRRALIAAACIIAIAHAPAALAACGPQTDGSYVMCQKIPGVSQVQPGLDSFFNEMVRLAFLASGTIIFLRIVQGGFLYIFSTAVERKKDANAIFKGVALGFALLMGGYVLLRLINPRLTAISLPGIEPYNPGSELAPALSIDEHTPDPAWASTEAELEQRLEMIQDRIQLIESRPGKRSESDGLELAALRSQWQRIAQEILSKQKP